MRFQNRSEAGKVLAAKLAAYRNRDDVSVVALPRGGVPVGDEVARMLRAPLDVLVVRKLGAPENSEFSIGAIASGNVRLLDEKIVRALQVSVEQIEAIVAENTQELERQEQLYRACHEPLVLRGRQAIVIDDGLATGWTMRAAILALRSRQPARIVVAVPVAAPSSCQALQAEADEVVCASTPASFFAVSQSYREFPQVSDEQVCNLLAGSQKSLEQPGSVQSSKFL